MERKQWTERGHAVDVAEWMESITNGDKNAFAVLICLLDKKREEKMQMTWKCLIFTEAGNNTAGHGKAQLVLKLTATIKTEWLPGLRAMQAKIKHHQAVSFFFFLSAVLLFYTKYVVIV